MLRVAFHPLLLFMRNYSNYNLSVVHAPTLWVITSVIRVGSKRFGHVPNHSIFVLPFLRFHLSSILRSVDETSLDA